MVTLSYSTFQRAAEVPMGGEGVAMALLAMTAQLVLAPGAVISSPGTVLGLEDPKGKCLG